MKRGSVCAVNLATDTFFEVKLKFFWRQTDRPTPQGIEAPSRSLKIINRNFKFQSSRLEQNHIVLRNENSDQK